MHTILGYGNKVIVFQNQDQSTQINTLLDRCIDAWNTMLHIGYPSVQRINREYKLIFTDEINTCISPLLSVGITQERSGLYYHHAFSYQLAKKYQETHQMEIKKIDPSSQTGVANIIIGMGKQDNEYQAFFELKDIILNIPLWI